MGAGGAGGGNLCQPTTELPPLEPGIHVALCSVINYTSNPPTSGSHYPIWAAFKSYPQAIPRGFWVHDMEHGAVVIAYNCPMGCAAELAQIEAMLAARPADPLCVMPLTGRYILTPDPLLDSQFAVVAWGAVMKSDCLNVAAMNAFIDQHYAKAPENTCANGVDVLDPGSGIPANCGEPVADAGTD